MSVVNQTTTIGSDKREDGGFRGHHRRPRRGDGEKWPERKQYTLCDQCGNIEEYPHHQDCQHRETSLLLDSFAELTRHNKEAEALTDAEALQLGLFVLDCVIEGDAGEEMFNVMCKCQAQLHRLLSEAMDERPSVFLFGSCVSMGCWDGHGDGDFAVVVPEMLSTGARAREARKKNADTFFEYNEETVNSLLTALSEGGEKSLICGVGRKMRNGGFLEEELDVVVHTRIPVVRRKRLVDQRYEPRQSNEPFVLEFFFENDLQHRDFLRTTLPRLVETYGCREMEEKTRCKLSVALDDSTSAFRLFSRSEWGGIRKQWLPGGRLPEIFYVDFDISSRIYGVRNSWFMRQYLIQDEVFRVGNLFVKTWSKARSVNNSRQGYLTSYAMTELWIHYLLQAGEATFVEPSSVGAYPSPSQMTVPYVPLWSTAASKEEDDARVRRLGRLISGFFHYYAHTFDWDREVVSLRRNLPGGEAPLTREEIGWTADKEVNTVMFRDRVLYNICIDDVYENNFNLGRHLSKGKADWFKLQFLLAADRCASVDERLEELITEVHPFAEATVKTDLYRCLIESPLGTSTVGLVRATLMIMNPYTSAFTLKHRLSDLWVQPQQTLSDIALLKRYQRNIDYPSDQEALAAAGWTATSDSVETEADGTVFDAFEISLTKKSETGNHKRHSIANEEELTALRARYDAALESALCSPESGCLLDEEDLGENSIVRRCLYCVDHRGFSTYYHRARFVRHLVALAQLMDHQKDGKNKKNQYFYIKATLPRREILRKRIMESILADERYVVPGTHTGTALLQSYVGSRGAEEKVRRVKQMGDRRSGGGHAKPVVRHDLSRPQRDVLCDECGRKRNCFPSTDPKVDRGVYCFECWQNYTK